jgi:hypothetical protein
MLNSHVDASCLHYVQVCEKGSIEVFPNWDLKTSLPHENLRERKVFANGVHYRTLIQHDLIAKTTRTIVCRKV